MIPDERAQRQGGYLQDGKEIVTFDPPLTLKEWEYLMKCQDIAIEEESEKEIENLAEKEGKKDGKETTEQTKTEEPEPKDE